MAKERISIQEMSARNAAVGHHWFEKDSMRFFNTRIESQPDKNNQFITSDAPPDGERRYTLREFDVATGHVNTIGEFWKHKTIHDARAFRKDYNS